MTVVASVDEALNVATRERERVVPFVPSFIEVVPVVVSVTVLAAKGVALASLETALLPAELVALTAKS